MRSVWFVLLLTIATEAHARKPKKTVEPEPPPAVAADGIEVPCTFAPGEVVRYRMTHTALKTGPSRPSMTSSYRYDVVFTVVSNESPFTDFDMRYEALEMLSASADPLAEELLAELHGAVMKETFRVRFDHGVKTQTVANPEALTRVGEATATAMGVSIRARYAGAPPEVVDQSVAVMQAMVKNPVMLARGLEEDSGPVFAFACGIWPAGETPYETPLANPFGGEPFNAAGVLAISQTKAGGLTFADRATVDPVGALTVVRPMLEQAGVPVPEELDSAFVDVRSETTVDLDGAGPWPTAFKVRKVASLAGAVDDKTMTATRLP